MTPSESWPGGGRRYGDSEGAWRYGRFLAYPWPGGLSIYLLYYIMLYNIHYIPFFYYSLFYYSELYSFILWCITFLKLYCTYICFLLTYICTYIYIYILFVLY